MANGFGHEYTVHTLDYPPPGDGWDLHSVVTITSGGGSFTDVYRPGVHTHGVGTAVQGVWKRPITEKGVERARWHFAVSRGARDGRSIEYPAWLWSDPATFKGTAEYEIYDIKRALEALPKDDARRQYLPVFIDAFDVLEAAEKEAQLARERAAVIREAEIKESKEKYRALNAIKLIEIAAVLGVDPDLIDVHCMGDFNESGAEWRWRYKAGGYDWKEVSVNV